MASILKDQINLKQASSHTYTIAFHADWTVGPVLHGGCVAAAIHHAASTHMATTLAAQNQPDILTLHLEFIRACETRDSTITVTDIKIGAGTSTLQLQLSQNEKVKVIAFATSIDFSKPVGPTILTAWRLHPAPPPMPNFDDILAHRPDPHWLPAHLSGEVIPFTRRQIVLNNRRGFAVDGVLDAWNTFLGDERMDATYLAMMVDCIPSMTDTLLRNGGLYDARNTFANMESWAKAYPGVPAELTNSLREAARATIFHNTITLDIEFKRRLPKNGVQWTFTRAVTRTVENGRLDLDVTMYDENMEILCMSRQVILAMDAKRKFGDKKGKSAL